MGLLRIDYTGGAFMENIGADIRRQREAKHLTIEELSQRTKISVAVLHDIEDGKFDRYKGDEAYVKMYLKKISNVLSLDADMMTQQYIDLTQEIQMAEMQDKEEYEHKHNEEVVKKGKKFSFEAPQLTRKPSVYEDKSHVTIVRAAIILVLVCLVIVVIWYGFYSTRSQSKDPSFQPQNHQQLKVMLILIQMMIITPTLVKIIRQQIPMLKLPEMIVWTFVLNFHLEQTSLHLK